MFVLQGNTSMNRFGVKRMQYTFNEYKSADPSQPRLPPTYSNSQNLLSMSKYARNVNANIPVPAHMIDPLIYAARSQKDRRRERRQAAEASAMEFSQDMSQNYLSGKRI